MNHIAKKFSFAILGLASLSSFPALAQQSTLEEIIVTAERRETNLQDTPISVNMLSSEALKDAGINNIEDLQSISPSLVASGNRASGNANMSVAIRGIGQRGGRAATGKGVGLYIDGVYFPVTQGSRSSFSDVSRLEVLRGPQGTLFGRNNVGGAIRLFTNPAEIGSTYGSVSVTGGEFNRAEIEGMVNVAATDNLAFRLVYNHEERDGYQKFVDINGNETGRDPLGSYDNDFVRLSTAWEISDSFSANLVIEDVSSSDNGVVYDIMAMPEPARGYAARLRDAFANEGLTLGSDDPRFLTSSEFTSLDSCLLDGDGLFSTRGVDSDPANPFPNCDTTRETDMSSYRLNLDWDINDSLTFKSITGYGEVDVENRIDWTTFGAYMRLESDEISYWSQEFQLSGVSNDSRLNWVAGVNISELDSQENINLWDVAPRSLTARQISLRGTGFDDKSTGIFAQGTYSVTDQLNLTLGVRYTDEEKEILTFRSDRVDGFMIPDQADWSDTNIRATLDYAWNDDVMTYVSYSTAFKAGSFSTRIDDLCNRGLTGDPTVCDDVSELVSNAGIDALDPEQVNNFEVGIRSEFGNRFRFNLTGFFMDYTDLQQRSRVDDLSDPDCSGGFEDGVCSGVFLPGSIGAEIKGIESELLFQATDSTTITANISKINTEITEADGVAGLEVGEPLDQAPELNYTLGIKHIMDLGENFTLSGSMNYSYKDSYLPLFSSDVNAPVEDVSTLSGRIQLAPKNGNWTLALGGSNLTDESYETNINHWANFIGQLRSADRQEPREWYLEFTYNFESQ